MPKPGLSSLSLKGNQEQLIEALRFFRLGFLPFGFLDFFPRTVGPQPACPLLVVASALNKKANEVTENLRRSFASTSKKVTQHQCQAGFLASAARPFALVRPLHGTHDITSSQTLLWRSLHTEERISITNFSQLLEMLPWVCSGVWRFHI